MFIPAETLTFKKHSLNLLYILNKLYDPLISGICKLENNFLEDYIEHIIFVPIISF